MLGLGLKHKLAALRGGYIDCGRGTFFAASEFHKLAEGHALGMFLNRFNVDCVIDVGANRGQYGSALRKNAGYRGYILSVEPIPAAFAELSIISKRDPLWHCENCALSEENGNQNFHIMAGDQFSSFLDPTSDEFGGLNQRNTVAETIAVRTRTLDALIDHWRTKLGFRRPFLKLDTQGYDHIVISSGPRNLSLMVGVQSEIAFKRLYKNSLSFEQMMNFLDQKGFSISAIFPNNAGHFPHCLEQDAIFFNRNFDGHFET